MCLLAIFPQGGNENARRIELMAAKLGHQTAARALEQSPAAELFERRSRAAAIELEIVVAILARIDFFVLDPRFPLRDLLIEHSCLRQIFFAISAVLQLFQLVGDEIDLDLLAVDHRFDRKRQGLLPTVIARQIAAMPLRPDVMDFAQEAPLYQV